MHGGACSDARGAYLGPQGAEQRGRVAATPPASGPRLWRSSAWCLRPPAPLWLRPLACPSARRHPYLSAKWRGVPGFLLRNLKKNGGTTGAWASRRLVHRRACRATGVCETQRVLHTEGVILSPENSRTRRAVHTLVVWAGELSRRGKGMHSAPAFAAFEELKEARTPQ